MCCRHKMAQTNNYAANKSENWMSKIAPGIKSLMVLQQKTAFDVSMMTTMTDSWTLNSMRDSILYVEFNRVTPLQLTHSSLCPFLFDLLVSKCGHLKIHSSSSDPVIIHWLSFWTLNSFKNWETTILSNFHYFWTLRTATFSEQFINTLSK